MASPFSISRAPILTSALSASPRRSPPALHSPSRYTRSVRSGALLCAVLAATAACRDRAHREPPKEPTVPADTLTPCAAAMRDFAAGKLDFWKGLPAGCTDRDIAAVFAGGGDPAGDGRLSNLPTKFRVYSTGDPKLEPPIKAWFDGTDTVTLITWHEPVLPGDAASLLAALGPPEQKLEPGAGYPASSHQWIYASRGLTLWVFEPRTEITRLAVYRPTTPADYEHHLGGRDQKRYLPRRP